MIICSHSWKGNLHHTWLSIKWVHLECTCCNLCEQSILQRVLCITKWLSLLRCEGPHLVSSRCRRWAVTLWSGLCFSARVKLEHIVQECISTTCDGVTLNLTNPVCSAKASTASDWCSIWLVHSCLSKTGFCWSCCWFLICLFWILLSCKSRVLIPLKISALFWTRNVQEMEIFQHYVGNNDVFPV